MRFLIVILKLYISLLVKKSFDILNTNKYIKGYVLIYTVKVQESCDTVKKEFEAKVKEVGFSLFDTYNFTKILQGKGCSVKKEIIVFELCSPPGAKQALSHLPELSVYLPSKISLYEDNGITTLTTIGLDDIINVVEADEQFKAYMKIIFENIKRVMHSWDK